ncbi:MAG: pilus assembly protein PilM [Pirellulaceae bacterium]
MAKTLAIDWDKNEVRFVTARLRGGGITLEEVVSVTLPTDEEKTNATFEKQIGEAIRAEVKKNGWQNAATTICIGRSHAEVQVLKLPLAPDDELPDLVRFQALREFSSFGEESTIDFVPIGKNEEGQIEVLAATLSAKQLKLHKKVTQQADLELKNLQLGPVATGGLLANQPALADKSFLIVELALDGVDLIVVKDRKVVFTRATNLPGEPLSETQLSSLQGEVRRTLMAARMKLGQQRLDQIVILGDEAMHPVRELLKQDFEVEVFVVNPFELANITTGEFSPPGQVGGYAPLLAALLNQSASIAPAIDFLNPRQRPAPVDRGSIIRLSVLGTIAAGLLIGFLIWNSLRTMDAEVAQLKSKLSGLEEENKIMLKARQEVEEIDQWLGSKVDWLDELHYLAVNLPIADDAILTRLNMQANLREGGGAISMNGYVSDSTVVSQMENKLQDDRRKVTINEDKTAPFLDVYHWGFQQVIAITPPEDLTQFFDDQSIENSRDNEDAASVPTDGMVLLTNEDK